MKTSLNALPILALLAVLAPAASATTPSMPLAAAAAAVPAEPDAAVLAQLTQAVRDGRFGVAYKRGLRTSPPGALRDGILALEDDIIGGVFARIAARRFTIAEATAIAAFYASPQGRALTEAQLAAPTAPAPAVAASDREAIAAFFASPTGRKFNAVLGDAAVRQEMQMALVFIAGPDAAAAKN